VSSIICGSVERTWNGTETVSTVIFAPILFARAMPCSTALSASAGPSVGDMLVHFSPPTRITNLIDLKYTPPLEGGALTNLKATCRLSRCDNKVSARPARGQRLGNHGRVRQRTPFEAIFARLAVNPITLRRPATASGARSSGAPDPPRTHDSGRPHTSRLMRVNVFASAE
jgi:hypothetical protein